MNKRWVARPQPDNTVLDALRDEIKTTEVLLKLIAQRDINNLSEALTFFQPNISQLHPPFLMKDMDKAVDRIQQAFDKGEKIIIYGDYDVDGTTSVALVYSFLRTRYTDLLFYIPDRFKEGYGISAEGIEWAKEQGATLVIALDCGIKSVDLIAKAKTEGIDFIICDHHTPGDEIPAAVAILNPKQSDCTYPYKELSGCGIGFKLAQACAEKLEIPFNPEEYLDLVTVSIASDIVHMTGENRILAYFGLERINTNPCPGLKALIELSGVKKELAINDLVFRLGPRINAAGRIASGKLAVEMLIEKDYAKAVDMASGINQKNTDRQGVDQSITKQAMEMIKQYGMNDRKTTVLFDKDWHKGVIGIVASRLIEIHYKPTILLTESNGYAVGSARSVPGFDLYNAIKQCDELLDQWGGHQAAAGLTLPLENVEAFSAKFEEVVQGSITEDLLTPVIEYDLEIYLSDITLSFCKSLERFGPFGPENMRPVFITKGVYLSGSPRKVGNGHLQFRVMDDEGHVHQCIAYGLAEYYDALKPNQEFDICYTVLINEFRGNVTPSITIKDILVPEGTASELVVEATSPEKKNGHSL
jgi:single-stranded-DNA-specific exonuclease